MCKRFKIMWTGKLTGVVRTFPITYKSREVAEKHAKRLVEQGFASHCEVISV